MGLQAKVEGRGKGIGGSEKIFVEHYLNRTNNKIMT
jgi:hypothetical protein